MNDFDQRFVVLRRTAVKEITESKISVIEFRQGLMTLPASRQNINEDFLLSKYSLFEKAKSIESIFLHLNSYLSYLDFSLLEHIIEQFGSERLKDDMSCYAQDMAQFKTRTTISDALKYLPKPRSRDRQKPEGFSLVTEKLDVDVNVTTLEKLDEYRKNFADELSLSHFAFFLFDVDKSSLLVTWLVPTAVGIFISDKISKKDVSFILKMNILKLSLDGEQLYPAPTKVHLLHLSKQSLLHCVSQVTTNQPSVKPRLSISEPQELLAESPTKVH